jgi:hypothetical protein
MTYYDEMGQSISISTATVEVSFFQISQVLVASAVVTVHIVIMGAILFRS